jgi:predicted negative regulator of RcsB-dependent stress response
MSKVKKRLEKDKHMDGDIKETIHGIRDRMKQRQKALVNALIAFLVIVVAVGGFFLYQKNNLAKAVEFESEALKFYYGSPAQQPLANDERLNRALDLFKKSYAAKKRPFIQLYVANCYYELGRYDEAITALNELSSRTTDTRLTSLAQYKTAMAYARKSDFDKALKVFNDIEKIKNSPFRDLAVIESAKILELVGRHDEAKEKYKRLVSDFPKSPLANEAAAKVKN